MDVAPTPKDPAVSSGSPVARCGAWKGNQPDSSVSNENAGWHCMSTRSPVMDTNKMSSFLHCGCMWLEDKQTLSSVALPSIPAHCMQAELGLPQCWDSQPALAAFRSKYPQQFWSHAHFAIFSPPHKGKNIYGPLWFQAKYPRNVNRIWMAIISWPTVADHEFLLLQPLTVFRNIGRRTGGHQSLLSSVSPTVWQQSDIFTSFWTCICKTKFAVPPDLA